MVCCPYLEVSVEASCDINRDQKSNDKLKRSKATILKFLNGKPEPVCGKRSSDLNRPRIADGKEAAPGDWPWMALLGYVRNGATEPNFECGGTLISLKNVLTSAHCLDKR